MNPIIVDGLKLLVLGMSGVFSFLAIMVVVIGLVAKAVAPFAHMMEPPPEEPRNAKKTKAAPAVKDDSRLAAAAVAAVHMHRNRAK